MVRSPGGVSFFSSVLLNIPPNVGPLVIVKVPEPAPSFFSPSVERPKILAVVTGVASFFSPGFAVPSSPPPVVPPGAPKAKPPVVEGTGVNVPDASGFLIAKKLLPNAGVAVEVDVEVVVLSAGLEGSPRNPPSVGVAVVVVVDGPLAGLGAPPNIVPVVVLVLGNPPKILDAAIGADQHQESKC